MKRVILLLILLSVTSIFAQEKIKVTFEVNSTVLNDTAKVYIVGNIKELGSWNPDKIMMDYNNNKRWSKTIEVNKGTRLEVKFTKGSWANEALGSDLKAPQNMILIATKDTTVLKTVINWRDNFNFKVKGQITGTVVYHKNFVLVGLKPRDIFVWLPPDYKTNTGKHYPVFYMHDGQNLVDPQTSYTFIDWQADECADSLIRAGIVEPFIIVGINNTADRSTEYSKTPLGKLYMKLIVEKIKPFIDKEYRTMPDAGHTAVGGSSMGGLISLICAWEYPDVFSKAACFSPAFLFSNFDYTKVVKEDKSSKKQLLIYIDNGGVGLDKTLQRGVDKMIEELKAKGFIDGKDLFIFIDEKAEHSEAAWARRVWRPFKIFFEK